MEEKRVVGTSIYLEQALSVYTKTRHESYYRIYKQGTDEHVGNCGIRIRNSDDMPYLGNIEYEIFEPFRGNGYAKEASFMLGNIAYEWVVTSLRITANIHNIPSLNVIKGLGAKFIQVVKVPKKCCLYKTGDRFLAIYDWNIEKRNIL